MLAPTVGPYIGGRITETLSWHWLFLINLGPGAVMSLLVAWLILIDGPEWANFCRLDVLALVLIAIF